MSDPRRLRPTGGRTPGCPLDAVTMEQALDRVEGAIDAEVRAPHCGQRGEDHRGRARSTAARDHLPLRPRHRRRSGGGVGVAPARRSTPGAHRGHQPDDPPPRPRRGARVACLHPRRAGGDPRRSGSTDPRTESRPRGRRLQARILREVRGAERRRRDRGLWCRHGLRRQARRGRSTSSAPVGETSACRLSWAWEAPSTCSPAARGARPS